MKEICSICGHDWISIGVDVTDEPTVLDIVKYYCEYCKHEIIPLVTPQVSDGY